MFRLPKTLEQGASKLFYKWQYIGHIMPDDLSIRVTVLNIAGKGEDNRTIEITFNVFYLGRAEQLHQTVTDQFPELDVQHKECIEMSIVDAHVRMANYAEEVTVEALASISPGPKTYLKSKSDFVRELIYGAVLDGLWESYLEQRDALLLIDAFGERMNEISDSELPFPYRKGGCCAYNGSC